MRETPNFEQFFNVTVEDINFDAKLSKMEKQDVANGINTTPNKRQLIRFLTDQYYQSQAMRIQAENRARALAQGYDSSDAEHPLFIQRMLKNARVQEALNQKYLDLATDEIAVCRWMKSIKAVGPVISAYLYQAFDINAVQYPTEFLSYAGLNDNNNKWLGKDGAKALAKEAIEYRKNIYDPLKHYLDEWIRETLDPDLDPKKLKSFYNRAIKTAKAGDFVNIDEIAQYVYKKIVIVPSNEYLEDKMQNYMYLDRMFLYIDNPKRVDDILINYAAKVTTRKPSNVKNGTVSTWQSKKNKTKEPTVSDFESYLAKPPYNPDLKKCLYNVGDCFVKNANRGSLYGRIYQERLVHEQMLNEQCAYKDQAERLLAEKNYDQKKDTYKWLAQGKLSPGHLCMRARRYAEKLFVSHVWEAMYYIEKGQEPPFHYTIAHQGHQDYIAPEVDYRNFR